MKHARKAKNRTLISFLLCTRNLRSAMKTISLMGHAPLDKHVMLQMNKLFFLLPAQWQLDVRVNDATFEMWMCVNDNWNAPIRLNADGDVECYASDGKGCIVTRKRGCPSLLKMVETVESRTSKDRADKNVLTCGTDHMRKWGVSGYDSPVHWCHRARSAFLQGKTATIICTSTGEVLGKGRFVKKYPQYFKLTSTTPAFRCAMARLSMA